MAGDPVARDMAEALGGRTVEVADDDRAAYHAAACIAANHVVALLGQVERVAATAGLPLDAFLGLTRAAVDDVASLGPAGALTGPARRGDWATLARHRDALAADERPGYNAGVALALELADAGRARWRPPSRRAAGTDATRRRRPEARAGRRGRRRPAVGARWAAVEVFDTADGFAAPWTRPAPRGGPSGSSPPWARCTPATARWWRGRPPSATTWR